jgi:hypothetical protein
VAHVCGAALASPWPLTRAAKAKIVASATTQPL